MSAITGKADILRPLPNDREWAKPDLGRCVRSARPHPHPPTTIVTIGTNLGKNTFYLVWPRLTCSRGARFFRPAAGWVEIY